MWANGLVPPLRTYPQPLLAFRHVIIVSKQFFKIPDGLKLAMVIENNIIFDIIREGVEIADSGVLVGLEGFQICMGRYLSNHNPHILGVDLSLIHI